MVTSRIKYINAEFLIKRGITNLSVGADGAGAFLKAMMNGSTLFTKTIQNNVPTSWSFYFMSSLRKSCLFTHDYIHMLAKMRTRLIIPSNILVLFGFCWLLLFMNFPKKSME